MSNRLYPKGKKNLGIGNIDLDTHTIKLIPVNTNAGLGTAYTYDATHEALSDVASGARLLAGVTLSGITFVDGKFLFTTPVTFVGIATGKSIGAWIVYKDSGVESTSYLLGYFDTGYGMPRSTNGNDVDFELLGAYLFQI